MANNIALIEKWLPNVVDTVFAEESKTALLENGSKFIDVDFKDAAYVRILDILMDGLSDYWRVNHAGVAGSGAYAHDNSNNGYDADGHPYRDGYHRGNTQATWEIYRLRYDRGKQFLVDNMDNEETAGAIIANLLTEFIRTKVVPEVDALRFSTIAGKANVTLGNLVSGAIAANTILASFNAGFEWLTEHEVPEEEQIIFVSPSVMTMLRSTTELVHFIQQADYKSEKGITFTLPAYEGRPIVMVPSDRFYTEIDINQNGYAPTANSKVINFMICSKKAILPIVKLNKSKIWSPETQDDFDGFKVNFRIYHDTIVPKNKLVGTYVSVSSVDATTKANLLDVALKTGLAANGVILDGAFTTPAGLLGEIYYQSSANAITTGLAKVGDAFTGTGFTKAYEGTELTIANRYAQFVLVSHGKVLAAGPSLDLNGIKKAA